MTIFDETILIEDSDDEPEIEIDEIQFHCPVTLTTTSGNSNDFIITKLTWSLHDYWINITLHPIEKHYLT